MVPDPGVGGDRHQVGRHRMPLQAGGADGVTDEGAATSPRVATTWPGF